MEWWGPEPVGLREKRKRRICDIEYVVCMLVCGIICTVVVLKSLWADCHICSLLDIGLC